MLLEMANQVATHQSPYRQSPHRTTDQASMSVANKAYGLQIKPENSRHKRSQRGSDVSPWDGVSKKELSAIASRGQESSQKDDRGSSRDMYSEL
jgi:hypothetical protein